MLQSFNWILGISIAFVYYLSPDFLQEVITGAILCTIKFTCPHAHRDKHIGFNAGDFLYEFGRDQTNVKEKMKFWHKICIMPIENCKIYIMPVLTATNAKNANFSFFCSNFKIWSNFLLLFVECMLAKFSPFWVMPRMLSNAYYIPLTNQTFI